MSSTISSAINRRLKCEWNPAVLSDWTVQAADDGQRNDSVGGKKIRQTDTCAYTASERASTGGRKFFDNPVRNVYGRHLIRDKKQKYFTVVLNRRTLGDVSPHLDAMFTTIICGDRPIPRREEKLSRSSIRSNGARPLRLAVSPRKRLQQLLSLLQCCFFHLLLNPGIPISVLVSRRR